MYRVRTVFTGITGAPWVNTLYFDEAGGSAQQAANAAGAFWGAVDLFMSTTISWSTESDVVTVNDNTGAATGVISTTPITGVGGSATEMLPRTSQALVRLLTGVFNDGRQIRGRIFLPGFTESSNAIGGIVAGATGASLQIAADALVSDANSALLVWSRAGGLSFPVVATSIWLQWAVLRSRRD